eukprot:CAMPEP_0180339616 /NCGR_PEP_ID=MMETSP0989-20121125/201_1 /TAXON_ID=697907 /ORGANISM="non described non described, Strain CCMP2293" /LENGTH=228 /DNA_ID=CAMNT_0022328225 /DNA_START=20 /DNA_END=702 /DNA_ORIENTATION=-
MGGQGSKEKRPVSGAVHLRDKKELCGVGLIFRRSPDGQLVVKEVVGGSSADESGLVEAGDVLVKVDDTKIGKSSIADISSMVLGEPQATVKLKFIRTVGKSKKKYKVVLKRTVRATLEPTYHVQRDGINTKVTHIHLDCLQNQDSGPTEGAAQARDVLDAEGNVVGPGLLQRSRMAQNVPGVERIDSSHPAWPGNRAQSAKRMEDGQLTAVKGPRAPSKTASMPTQPA